MWEKVDFSVPGNVLYKQKKRQIARYLHVTAHTCKLRTQEAEAGGLLCVQG